MASSSSSSGRDVLIYLFYHADITHKNSDSVFPRIHTDTKFIDMFEYEFLEYSNKRSQEKAITSKVLSESDSVSRSTYRIWAESSTPCIIKRSDSKPDVDVFYITNTFVANQDNPKNIALINHIVNKRYDNKYIYAVRFCDHINDFKNVQSMKELKLTVTPNESPIDDFNFFIRDAYPIWDHFFIDDYFKKAGLSTSVSDVAFYRFIERLGITNTRLGDHIIPCFTYRNESQIDKNVVRDTLINKYTNFFFFPFETYTTSIYVDYMHKIGMPTSDLPVETFVRYPIGDIIEYERMIIGDLQREIENMYLKNTLLEERLAQAESIREELMEEQRARLERSQRMLLELQGRVREISSESSESIVGASSETSVVMRRTKIQELQAKVRELKEEVKSLRTEVRRLQTDNANLQSIITQHQDIPEQLEQMQGVHREMTEDVDRLTANLLQKNDEIADLHTQLAARERTIQERDEQIDDLNRRLSSLPQSDPEEIMRLNERIQTLMDQNASSLDELLSCRSTLAETIREKDEIIADLRRRLEELERPPTPPITGTSGTHGEPSFVRDLHFEDIQESIYTHLKSVGEQRQKSFSKMENAFSRDMFIFA